MQAHVKYVKGQCLTTTEPTTSVVAPLALIRDDGVKELRGSSGRPLSFTELHWPSFRHRSSQAMSLPGAHTCLGAGSSLLLLRSARKRKAAEESTPVAPSTVKPVTAPVAILLRCLASVPARTALSRIRLSGSPDAP
jgi:hypothetical protein